MKIPDLKSVNFNDIITTVQHGDGSNADKAISLLKHLSSNKQDDNGFNKNDIINLVTANSESIEEAFGILAVIAHMTKDKSDVALLLMALHTMITGSITNDVLLPDETSELYIREDETDDIGHVIRDAVGDLDPENLIEWLTIVQKSEKDVSWKTILFEYFTIVTVVANHIEDEEEE